jgi:hypothetical protein
MYNIFVARWDHLKSIGNKWWSLVLGAYGLFFAADEAIEKWNPLNTKMWWEAHTPHLPTRWEAWLIGLLVITVMLVLEGSFQHARRFTVSNVVEEHDPKVYFEPINSDFIPKGELSFDVSNKGQRVNVAHRIKVQPIALLPSVTFDCIDHLDMNEHRKLLPLVNPPSGWLHDNHNILLELETAWKQRHQKLGTASEEFPFEIVVNYEDVSGRKKFERTISLIYSAKKHGAAIAEATAPQRREFNIIKVADTKPIRRLL